MGECTKCTALYHAFRGFIPRAWPRFQSMNSRYNTMIFLVYTTATSMSHTTKFSGKISCFFSAYSRGLYLQEQESSYPLLEIEKPVCAAARLSFRVEYLTIPSANFSCAQRLQPCAASWQLCDLTYLSRSTPGACISLVTCGLVFRILLKASDRES